MNWSKIGRSNWMQCSIHLTTRRVDNAATMVALIWIMIIYKESHGTFIVQHSHHFVMEISAPSRREAGSMYSGMLWCDLIKCLYRKNEIIRDIMKSWGPGKSPCLPRRIIRSGVRPLSGGKKKCWQKWRIWLNGMMNMRKSLRAIPRCPHCGRSLMKQYFSHLLKGVCFALQSSDAKTYRLLRKLNIFPLPAPSTPHEAFDGQVRELMG